MKKPKKPVYYYRLGDNEEGAPITEVWLGGDVFPSARYAGWLTAKEVAGRIYTPSGKCRTIRLRQQDHWAIPSMEEATQIESALWLEQKMAEKKVSDGVQILRRRGMSASSILYLVANAM